MAHSQQSTLKSVSSRVAALDWMRGLVMVLMTLDHASEMFNAGRLVSDAAWLYKPGAPLPAVQFLVRWITHLCAPTFVFLAGTSLALSVERRSKAGESAAAIDRGIITRGLFIAAMDPLWMSVVFTPGLVLLQVLFAIGMSFVCMVPLRRLSSKALISIALGLMLFGEALIGLVAGNRPSLAVGLLLSGGEFGKLLAGYPLLPWLAIMLLGWVFGRQFLVVGPGSAAARRLLWTGALVAFVVFAMIRGLNGYGNMQLLRKGPSFVQWLHVSKYPPSLSFYTLELGLMGLCLALLFRWNVGTETRAGISRLLVTFGQTAFFFYLLHAHLLWLAAWSLGIRHQRGLAETLLATAMVSAVLYPCCRWYRGYKGANPSGWARYV